MKRSMRYFLALAMTAALILGAVMPALAAEPEETAGPEATAAPAETTSEPEATAAPVETTDEPEQTTEPETTDEPEQTAEPETTSEPEQTAEPEATTGPEATDAPAVTEEPETTEEPVAEAASLDVGVRVAAGGESRDYATIDEAWAAATQAGTATVILLADVTAQDVLTVPAGVSITFAGGEYTLTTACIRVDGGVLTVASGTVLDAGDGSSGKMGAIRIYAGLLTVNGGTMRGLNSGIYCDGGDTTINGGVIYGENGGLAVTDADSLTVNGGDISGGLAGIACTGDNRPVINGGSISGKGGGGVDISIGVIAYSGLVLTGGEISGGDAGVMSIGDTTVTGGSVTGTEGVGLLIGEDGSASLSGGAYAGVSGAVSCGGIDILGYPIESALTVNDLPAYGYGWYGADGALLTPAADEKTLAGPVTVGPLPVAPATPVLKVTGENVLLSSDPTDIDQEYDTPLTDGDLIEGGGRIVVPAEYVVGFPGAGVEITQQRYKFDNRYEPDTPIYHRYVFKITDPTLEELTVTVSPNPDTPTWTKVIAHTYADFYWKLTDCASNSHYDETADDEWIFYAAEDAGGVTLDLSKALEGVKPLMKTGTATDLGGGKYNIHSENDVIEFTLAPGGIKVNVTGETDALIKASEYVMDRNGENYFRVYVKTGYTVVPADENTEVTVGYISENDDGSDRLRYHVNADAAAEKGLDSVTVRVEKITSATLSVNEPDALLAADPYGSDRGPILTDGDVIPPEGGWLLTKSDWWFSGDNDEYAYDWRAAAYGEPGSEIYKWTYVYPLKDGAVNITLEPSDAPAHWAEVTIDNPGHRELSISAYAGDQAAQFDSDTYSASMIVSNYMFIRDAAGSLRKAADITDVAGVESVEEHSYYLELILDPTAEKISFTVTAPEGGTTPAPTPAPTATPEPMATAEPTATPVPTATAAPTAVPTATATPAAGATAAPGTTSPKTGDETVLAPWALMLLGCGAALIAVIARRRARR